MLDRGSSDYTLYRSTGPPLVTRIFLVLCSQQPNNLQYLEHSPKLFTERGRAKHTPTWNPLSSRCPRVRPNALPHPPQRPDMASVVTAIRISLAHAYYGTPPYAIPFKMAVPKAFHSPLPPMDETVHQVCTHHATTSVEAHGALRVVRYSILLSNVQGKSNFFS